MGKNKQSDNKETKETIQLKQLIEYVQTRFVPLVGYQKLLNMADETDGFVKPLIKGMKILNHEKSASTLLLLLAVFLRTRSKKNLIGNYIMSKEESLITIGEHIHSQSEQVKNDLKHFINFLINNAKMIITYEQAANSDVKKSESSSDDDIIGYLRAVKDCWNSLNQMSCTPVQSLPGYDDLITYAFIEQANMYYKAYHLINIADVQGINRTEYTTLKSQLTTYASQYWIQITKNENIHQNEYIVNMKENEKNKKNWKKMNQQKVSSPRIKKDDMTKNKAHLCHSLYNTCFIDFITKRNKQVTSDNTYFLETQSVK